MVKKKVQESLSNLLSLPRIIPRLLGFNDIIEIVKHLRDNNCQEYEYREGKSNFIDAIIAHNATLNPPFNILNNDLFQIYDDNIKNHVEIINKKRTLTITLKPFQYLSLLFTEIMLDLKFRNEEAFLEILNSAVDELNKKRPAAPFNRYTKEDINKICFWMATGSGKTIIMHINYLQYLHYAKNINNVILLTPNDDLSNQHKKELDKSSIPSIVSNNLNSRFILNEKDLIGIKILDFNKIRDKQKNNKSQKDKGVTIDYRSFGKNNLIIVDEGHRGSKGNTWLEMRQNIAREGFTFEYSATFHDVMDKKTEENSSDYKKTILFDYSYKYFYNEGYGKDYDISNLPDKDTKDIQFYIMLGNLLSFYEQKLYYNNHKTELETKFNIENPLWLLVGSSVNPKSGKDELDRKTISDIQEFIVFLSDLKFKIKKVQNKIKQILTLKTNIKYKDSKEDFFKDKFEYLKEIFKSKFKEKYDLLMNDIFKVVFYSNSNAHLVISNIKTSEGEIGLKYADGKYFGLVYIGKGSESKIIDDIIKKHKEIQRHDKEIGYPLFRTLNKKIDKHPLNLLIGAKKFIEGWDNFRISSMLLLNFAKGKGASAIQLFGRGVRLKGHNFSMKRSSSLTIQAPKNMEVIETLNVFGIHADYMEQFKEEIEEQGEIRYIVEKRIKVWEDYYGLRKDLKTDLYYLREKPDLEKNFKEDEVVNVKASAPVIVTIDTFSYVISLKSLSKSHFSAAANNIDKNDYYTQFKDLVNWNSIFKNVLVYKRVKGFNNIFLNSISEIKEIFEENKSLKIEIMGNKETFNVSNKKTIEELQEFKQFLEDLYSSVIKKYLNKIYTSQLRKLSESSFEIGALADKDIIPYYTIRIEVDKHQKPIIQGNMKDIIEKILEAKSDISFEEIDIADPKTKSFIESKQNKNYEFMIDFNKHVYFPLLIDGEDGYSISPTGLNEGELSFVEDLKEYLNKNKGICKNKKVILLRNHENKGIGFYMETKKFYYDFILWIIENDLQKIYFIDPKGLVYRDDEKRDFNKDGIKGIQMQLKTKEKDKKFELGCYIISQTHLTKIGDDQIKESPRDYNIYFKNNIIKLFDEILS